MTTIYLARHGQDEDNLNGILNGHRNQPLTDLGIQQATFTADHIKEQSLLFGCIYSSPLHRAYKTAQIIAETNNLPEPEKLHLLIERDFGDMEGKSVKDIETLCAPNILKTDTVTYFLNPEGAETFHDLLERASKIINFVESKYTQQSVLLVTHGDIGKMIYAHYYNLPWQEVLSSFHFGNCDLLMLSRDLDSANAHVFTQNQHNH
jgi:broad specificity phosphatase PhoE